VPLADVWDDTGPIEDAAARGPAGLAAAVAARIREAPDHAVRAAAGGISVGLGDRQLRRRFADAVGYGPKTLDRILRFQRFLVLARATTANLARLAIEAGYADQAHLTRECTRLSGLPPAALLASGAGPAGETSDSFKTAGPALATIAA
jgi:transcriptional regulator GlxA family with amidase domain